MPTRTELIWDGKYDDKGKRTPVLRAALPFQTVETVNESAGERKSLFSALDRDKPWRNRLIWGDKKYVLPSLLPEFAGKVNLIYIDPPFDTGADFSFNATIHDGPDDEDGGNFTKQPSVIEQKAYRDTWGRGIDSYLQWFYETAALLHELLSEGGGIYVHLDWHVGHYAKVVLDEIFGIDCFQAEIVWKRATAHNDSKNFGSNIDIVYYYTKGTQNRVWNQLYTKPNEAYLSRFRNADPDGRKWQDGNLTAKGLSGGGYHYEYKGVKSHWRMPIETMKRLDSESRLHFTKNGGIRLKFYLDEAPGISLQSLWDDIFPINSQAIERVDYPTQKPEALLERIIKASSNEGDLVLDCFCGSGTTAAVSEKLGRRWITCDLGRFAVHTARKRLLGIPDVKPFVVQNLGKYERQLWQTGQFAPDGPETAEKADARHRAYTDFILELYHAEPVRGFTWLHGKKGGRFVHVGGVDGPVTDGDVKKLAIEFKKAMGTGKDAPTTNGIDVLGWDFAFELNEVTKQQAEAANLQIKFKRIPRDVMDKRAVEQGDVHFFEMAALGVKASAAKKKATVELTDFVIPPDDVPADVQSKVTHWSQWVDFWAVDWHHAGDTFHNEWQAFRTKAEKKLPLTASHEYEEPGEYRVMVKVIDILGNDTTKTVVVRVK